MTATGSTRPWAMTDDDLDSIVERDRDWAVRTSSWLAIAAFLAFAALTAAAVVLLVASPDAPVEPMFVCAAFLLAASAIGPLSIMATHRARRRRWRRRQRECQELEAIVAKIKDRALGELISFNFRLMDRFVAVALAQAQASYTACVVAASTGLLILFAGSAYIVVLGGTSRQIVAGVLTALGTSLSGYLSVTFLKTFQMTSTQMSYYYGQPLVHCYLLHAEWLVERFEKGADEGHLWGIREKLLQSVLAAAGNAQDHLLDLQLATPRRRAKGSTHIHTGDVLDQ